MVILKYKYYEMLMSAPSFRQRVLHSIYPGINMRVTGPFLVIVAIIAGIGVFIVTRLVAGSLQERFNNQLLDSARAASNSIGDVEREQLGVLRSMVFTEGVSTAIQSGDTAQLVEWLEPIAANARVDDVIVFDRSGRGVLNLMRDNGPPFNYTTGPPPDIQNWAGAQQVLQVNQDALGDKFVDVIDAGDGYRFYITAPVKDADGRVVGGISLGMTMQRLTQLASEQSLSAVALYYYDGTVLGSTFLNIDAAQLRPAQPEQIITQSQSTSPIVSIEFGDASYQVLYAPFRLRDQTVGLMAVGLPSNFIVERISTSRNWFAVLFSALFLVVAALGLITARTIIQPIRLMVSTMRAIRDGDLSRRVDLHTPDEFGEMATSFDHMTAQLVTRNAEVEALYHQQRRETAQREAVLASIGDAVIVLDPAGMTMLRNQAADDLVSAIRQNAADQRLFGDICRQPDMFTQPHMVELAGHHYSIQARPVHVPAGGVMGHVLAFRDISALVESERLKDELILQMSHELRTPLTGARGYVDLLRVLEQNKFTEQGQRFVDGALTSMTTLERMVNKVIDVSAIITGHFSIDITRVDLAELLYDCARDWAEPARERRLDFTVSVPAGEIWIDGDRRYLAQLLDYLMGNAYSYTLPGGSVELCALPKDERAVIYVMDSGVGIAPDELDRVFERMYRGTSAGVGETDTRGLGLGLYLSKHIVESHGGTISLESKLNFGTVVTVELPVQQRNGHVKS
jgi:signal transduction histidine kinase/HAMP domain-containing protein